MAELTSSSPDSDSYTQDASYVTLNCTSNCATEHSNANITDLAAEIDHGSTSTDELFH